MCKEKPRRRTHAGEHADERDPLCNRWDANMPPDLHPITGVETSVAGFLGRTEQGSTEVVEIGSWHEYQGRYGGHLGIADSFMSYAVQGFFENGGQRCFVARVATPTL